MDGEIAMGKPMNTSIKALQPERRIDPGLNQNNPAKVQGPTLKPPVMPYKGVQKGPIPK